MRGLSSLTHSASLEWSGFSAKLCTLLISAVAASREFRAQTVPGSANVLRFWDNNRDVFPRLYAITRKIFCVPATTAGVERLFSISGFILSAGRMNLTDQHFEDQVFTHCNSDLLGSVSRKRKPNCM